MKAQEIGRDDLSIVTKSRRGIAGSLVFSVFNRNSLMDEMRNADEGSEYYKDGILEYHDFRGGDESDLQGFEDWRLNRESAPSMAEANEFLQRAIQNNSTLIENAGRIDTVSYADQIKPFDVVVNMNNEAGEKAKLVLRDLEILNQGSGVSIQDLAISQNYTFVARDIDELTPIDNSGQPYSPAEQAGGATDLQSQMGVSQQ